MNPIIEALVFLIQIVFIVAAFIWGALFVLGILIKIFA